MAEFTRGPANVDDILTTTLDKYRGKMTENWLRSFAVTKKLQEADNVKYEDGGNSIIEDIEFAHNNTARFVAQTDTLSTAINQTFTQAHFSWAVLAATVGIGDHDVAKNQGDSRMHDLLAARVKNVENSMTESLETALISAVTPNLQTPWSLLDVVDSANPALGNYGDIDRSTYTWWAATESASGSMATQGLEDMRTAYLTTSRGGIDPISYILTTQTLYAAYQARLQPQERIAPADKGDLELTALTFQRKPIFFSELMAAQTMLGINSKYLKLSINSKMQFKNQPFVRALGGQSQSSVIQLMCQITNSRCASHFKLTGMTA